MFLRVGQVIWRHSARAKLYSCAFDNPYLIYKFFFLAMGSSVEEDNYDQEAFIVEGISLLIVGLIGILGNVSAILVFSR